MNATVKMSGIIEPVTRSNSVIFIGRQYFCSRFVIAGLLAASLARAGTVAQWLFDEQKGIYPSCLLSDSGPNDYFLALGRGGRLVDGRFGHALEPSDPAPLHIAVRPELLDSKSAIQFGLVAAPTPPGRTVPPMTWKNALLTAFFTTGEKQLRTPGFANPTDTKLNLGAFDWTVEFWYRASTKPSEDGVVFEIGSGPRGENDRFTRLSLAGSGEEFILVNQPAGVTLRIPSAQTALRPGAGWHHLAFVYDAAQKQLRHYVDGRLQRLPKKAALEALPHGDEAYFSLGRDNTWAHPLPGAIDELRFSDNDVYTTDFTPPGSFSETYGRGLPKVVLKAGPPLLFGSTVKHTGPIDLDARKYLFLDDSLTEASHGIRMVANPPKRMEKVIDELHGHMSMVEDSSGLIRLYYQGPKDTLAVMTSRDGIHWEKPDLGHGEYLGQRNIVVRDPTALGNVFIDPNAPPSRRWKFVSGVRKEAIFVFSSSDGFSFHRFDTPALPFAAGSQSVIYYDDQRQLYVGHHRSDYGETVGGHTRRRFVRTEVKNLLAPWPFTPATPEMTRAAARREHIQADKEDPWFLDNGPLTPPGFGIEYPTAFATDETFDPPGTDIYVTKVVKYAWAPDTYLAFPSIYFHYAGDGPEARQILAAKERRRGSGVVEVQLAVSRDGLSWTRYPRPAYVGIGDGGANRHHEMFMVQGLVRRGNEVWQYVTGHPGNGVNYHSAWVKSRISPVWRLVQRLDGFVAAEADYTGGTLTTKPLVFRGNQLHLNLNTGAVGYAQVGIVNADGSQIPGFGVDDCIYINGDFIDAPVEWMHRGTDVSALAGKPVKLIFRMRGAKLFAMQFVSR